MKLSVWITKGMHESLQARAVGRYTMASIISDWFHKYSVDDVMKVEKEFMLTDEPYEVCFSCYVNKWDKPYWDSLSLRMSKSQYLRLLIFRGLKDVE